MANTSVSHRAKMLPFVGHPRNQEAIRKRVVRDLLCEAASCEKRAAKIRKLANMASSVEALRSDHGRTLAEIITVGCTEWIADLFGVSEEYRLADKSAHYTRLRYARLTPFQRFLLDCVSGYTYVNSADFNYRAAAGEAKREHHRVEASARVEPFPENVIEFPLTPERKSELALRKLELALRQSHEGLEKLRNLAQQRKLEG